MRNTTVIAILFLCFGIAGHMDYTDATMAELENENLILRAYAQRTACAEDGEVFSAAMLREPAE